MITRLLHYVTTYPVQAGDRLAYLVPALFIGLAVIIAYQYHAKR